MAEGSIPNELPQGASQDKVTRLKGAIQKGAARVVQRFGRERSGTRVDVATSPITPLPRPESPGTRIATEEEFAQLVRVREELEQAEQVLPVVADGSHIETTEYRLEGDDTESVTQIPDREVSPITSEPKISIKEVKEKVVATGACADLDSFRIPQASLREDLSIYLPEESDEATEHILAKTDEKVASVKAVLGEALSHDAFITYLTTKSTDQPIRPDEMQRYFASLDTALAERIAMTMNIGIDPELIPLALKLGYANMPDTVVTAIDQNAQLKNKIALLLTNKQFIYDFARIYPNNPDTPPYSDEVQANVEEVMTEITTAVSESTASTPDTLAQTHTFLRGVFNLDHQYWPQQDTTIFQLMTKAHQFTGHAYTEVKRKQAATEQWDPVTFGEGFTLRTFLERYGTSIEKGKYAVELFDRTTEFYRKYLPQLYEDVAIDGLELTEPGSTLNEDSSSVCREANGAYSHDHRIRIDSATALGVGGTEALEEVTTSFLGVKAKRKVVDMIVMLHEYTHGIHEGIVHGGKQPDITKTGNKYYDTIDSAVNEGVAVLAELIAADIMKEHPEEFSLDEKDLQDLETGKQTRLLRLKQQKNAYTEGTFKIVHKIYAEAAGKPGERNVGNGLQAVRDFLQNIDPKKTMTMMRTDPQYIALLKNSSPQAWKDFLYKSEPEEIAQAA